MTRSNDATVNTTRADLAEWVSQIAKLTRPDRVHWVTGSAEERQQLIDIMLEAGTIEQLNPELRPDSYVARSDASDVARLDRHAPLAEQCRRSGHRVADAVSARPEPTRGWRQAGSDLRHAAPARPAAG